MLQGAVSDAEPKIIAILRVLSESSEPLGSVEIARQLKPHGVLLSERAVRYHLKTTDERGFTVPMGRDGRMITSEGLEELRFALAPDQVSFMRHRLELLAFLTTFDPKKRTGQVPINTSLFDKERLREALVAMRGAFKAGLCVSELVAMAGPGEKLGDAVVPSGKVGLATICSVIINGILLKRGVPTESRFGGVLEIRRWKPRRFVAVIDYAGTSVDPSEQYIRAAMTSVSNAVATGNGRILANFREMPGPARPVIEELIPMLKEAKIGGVYYLGETSESVCQVAIGLNRIGMVLLGGLNPLAAVAEAGIESENVGESGTMDYERLVSFWDL
ncbi:MAG: NrpR regulatory domain-containing protein [Dehalococcoidia bacterium]|nr:NrpR regulatory domain-containing protein [Dehalococcoidia bacterium]